MKLDAVKQTFIVECSELLANMESALLILEKQPLDHDSINAVFRAAHTIKGSSGMFGYTGVVEFTHVIENFLEKLRQGKFTVNSDMIAILLKSGDHMSELISLYTNTDNYVIDKTIKSRGDQLLEDLSKIQPGMVINSKTNVPSHHEEKSDKDAQNSSRSRVANSNWHISLRCTNDIFKMGLDPASFINYLSETGEIINVLTLADAIPELDKMDAEECYLGFEITLKSEKTKETIQNIFEFLLDNATLMIIEPHADLSEYEKLINSLPQSRERMKEVFLESGVLTSDEFQKLNTSTDKETQKEADMVLENVKIESEGINHFEESSISKKETSTGDDKISRSVSDTAANFIRIEAKKLDNLINLVGELVINVANIKQLSENNGDKDIIEASLTMSRLVEEVRDSAMNIRMVQIGETFKRFERVVRDLSRQMGKQIQLEISGGETELDKTVVERINDPLMHLIRNSIDHGIGTPEDRKKHGKNPVGTIRINALHETGNIVIEITDDGEGLNKEKILKKAIEKKVAKASQAYSDEEIYNFIFEPGLSTSDTITDVSGRGVGMDVVRRNIELLRGSIEIDSQPHIGTTMRISLPLTLAIIDGFLVEIGSVSYVIPLDMVLECINISSEDEISKETGNFVNLRGEVLPYLRMKEFFNVDDADSQHSQDNIIVVRYGSHKAGLLVDRLIGEYQTVIKPLGKLFSNLHGISGATILGNGTVSLILDIPKLIKHAAEMEMVGEKNKN
ncbi:MAG: chemotaxis protein CheA [Spirochaetia bacterium]|nr:chemotaxis protein CheA [Spirochaetia bacterium]